MRQDSVLLAFGSHPWICQNVARAACTLWSRGSWLGGPWFPHCTSVASWLTNCCMALCVFLFMFLVFVFCLARWQLNDCVSIHFSSLLYHIVIMTNVTTALIRWICTMQLSFRLDKRSGKSHLALDGKKLHLLFFLLETLGSKMYHISLYFHWTASMFAGHPANWSGYFLHNGAGILP